jgi:hypothetical protein
LIKQEEKRKKEEAFEKKLNKIKQEKLIQAQKEIKNLAYLKK